MSRSILKQTSSNVPRMLPTRSTLSSGSLTESQEKKGFYEAGFGLVNPDSEYTNAYPGFEYIPTTVSPIFPKQSFEAPIKINNNGPMGLSDRASEYLDLIGNENFIDELVNRQDGISVFNEMLETIKSDPFNHQYKGITFDPKDYEVFNQIKSTGAGSFVEAALGPEAYANLTKIAKSNNYNENLLNALTEQARSQPGVAKILENKELSDIEKLSLVAQETGNYVKNNMALLGTVEQNGKLKPGLETSDAISIVFGKGSNEHFNGENGIFKSLQEPDYKDTRTAYFDISDPNSAGAALAKSLGVDINSSNPYSGAVITKDGVKFITGSELPSTDQYKKELDKIIKPNGQDQWANPSDSTSTNPEEHKPFADLLASESRQLSTENQGEKNKSSEKLENTYASLILKKFESGQDESLAEKLKPENGSIADYLDGITKTFNETQKTGFNINGRDPKDTLGKMSGLGKEVDKIISEFSGKGYTAGEIALLTAAGITNPDQMSPEQKKIFADYRAAENLEGRNTYAWYENKLNDYVQSGILPEYILKHKDAAERIININRNDGSMDNMNAYNLLSSVATLGHILENPETAYINGSGTYVRATGADDRDHNGAFGLNSGNRYNRGAPEAALSLFRFGDVGNLTIYTGNGMTDIECANRLNRTMRVHNGPYQVGARGELANVNDQNEVRGLGIIQISEEGHGNTNGNYGVAGGFDKSDSPRFKIYADLVKGTSFVLNCVACSNAGGNNSYAQTVIDNMSEHLQTHQKLYAFGAENPTPPGEDNKFLLPGVLAVALDTNSNRMIVGQGQKEISEESRLILTRYRMNDYGILVPIIGEA